MRDDLMKIGHFAIALEGVPWGDVRNIPLLIATVLIGSYDQGSFHGAGNNVMNHFTRMAIDRKSALSFQAFNTQYQDTGLFGLYFTSTREKAYDVARDILYEWNRFAHCIPPKELQRGKELLKTQYLMSLEGTQPLFDEVSRQILYRGRRVPYEEFAAEVDAVSLSFFKDVMHDICDERDLVSVALGPTEGYIQSAELNTYQRSLFT